MKKLIYVLAALLILSGLVMVGYSVIVTPPDPYLTDPTIPDQPKEPKQTPPSPKQPEEKSPMVTQ